MMKQSLTRRNFIQKTGGALGAAVIMSQIPLSVLGCDRSKLKNFGFQVWTIREKLVDDFPGTLKEMSGMGYTEVEMCSPLGYSNAGFEPLNKLSGNEMRKIIEDSELTCVSSHYNMGELRDHLENRIEWAQQLGMKQMVAASFWLAEGTSVDDYRKAADELNEIGEKTKAAGIQMAFHNHHMEFEKRGGELIYDALLDQFGGDLVKMQFQVAVVNIGYQAADYFRRYPGRFISAHLSDWAQGKDEEVPVGQGIVDWKDFFKAAETGGLKNFFVEMAPETFKESADYLRSL